MPVAVSAMEVQRQSEAVFNQFGESVWIPNAQENAKLSRGNIDDLRNAGIGKFLLLCAMGESLETNIETIRKYRDRVDVVTCDKGFGPLLDHGIKADFVMICDANIPFHYMEKYVEKTEGVTLISTPYANPQWTKAWRGPKYFYINKDAIVSERIFLKIFGHETRTIPAGSNVSNAMLVFFTGSDNLQNVNWGGYERIFLVGYDYSWRPEGNYYAWLNPKPKRHYMNHRTLIDAWGNIVFTSENLLFSAKWLYSYITSFGLPAVNCSGRGILDVPRAPLEPELARINPDKRFAENSRQMFNVAKHANVTFEKARLLFEKSREDLITWQ